MNNHREGSANRITALAGLMYIGMVSLANSVISFLPFVPGSLTTWISRFVMAAVVVCLFRLAPTNERYKTSGILRGVMLACSVITSFLFGSWFLTLAASLCSIIATFQEYRAHAESVAGADEILSGKWDRLFCWEIAAAVLLSFGSGIVALIFIEAVTDAARLSAIVITVLSIPQMILKVCYILYMKRMIGVLNSGETE